MRKLLLRHEREVKNQMPTLRQIKQEIEQGNSLKQVTQIYSEISTLKIKQIRDNIERNRGFIREIGAVYQALQAAAVKQNIRLPAKKKATLNILLTSNYRFYGDLETKLTRFFITQAIDQTIDRLVIGRVGRDYINSGGRRFPFEYYSFKTDKPTLPEIGQLMKQISQYQRVLVFYSQLKSVLVQESKIVDISQSPSSKPTSQVKFDFIFEPEVAGMLKFFDTSISSLLLEQTILESELARTASRIISMDQAESNAETLIKKQQIEVLRYEQSAKNARLLNTISSLLNMHKDHGR